MAILIGLNAGIGRVGMALSVAEQSHTASGASYSVTRLERLAHGASGRQAVDAVASIVREAPSASTFASDRAVSLAVGSAEPRSSILEELSRLRLQADVSSIMVLANDDPTPSSGPGRASEYDLVGAVNDLLTRGRLTIVPTLPYAFAAREEVLAFQVEGPGAHYDLVLAIALACWCGGAGIEYVTGVRAPAGNVSTFDPVSAAAEEAVGAAVALLDTRWATLRLLRDAANPSGSAVLHRAVRSHNGVTYERFDEAPLPTRKTLAVLWNNQEHSGDAASDPGSPPTIRAEGMRAYVALPVLPPKGGAALGVLFLNRDGALPYSDSDRVVARRLAADVAQVLWQSQMEGSAVTGTKSARKSTSDRSRPWWAFWRRAQGE